MTALTETTWGTNILAEVSSAEPDADPVWVDISQWVIVPNSATLDTWLGRVTELDTGEDGHGAWLLNNNDERFTPGNPSSPYYPWWKQARRVRVREIVGYLSFDLADGYLEIPETAIRTQPVDGTSQDIVLSVSFVDIMGRLRSARAFVSTVAAHIRHHGGTSLVSYWPLGDAAVPVQSFPMGQPLERVWSQNVVGAVPADPALASLTFNGGTPLPGDDLTPPDFQPSVDRTTTPSLPLFVATYKLTGDIGPYTLSAGQVMTLVVWVRADEGYDSGVALGLMEPDTNTVFAAINWDNTGSVLTATASASSAWSGSITGPYPGLGRWVPVGFRFGFDPAVCEMWVGSGVYTNTMTVTSAAAKTFTFAYLGGNWRGQLAHAQVYLGAEADWTHEDFLAQYEVGLLGLERQTTGERVNAILDYAGFPAGRRDIDPGTSVMQRANLAGLRPADALERARETEQGRLFAQGGRVQFHDRRRIYDI